MTVCRNAGLKDLHIHGLRYVFASKMVMNGTSLYITGELLEEHRTYILLHVLKKHAFSAKEYEMTKRYSHLAPETLKKAVDEVWGERR